MLSSSLTDGGYPVDLKITDNAHSLWDIDLKKIIKATVGLVLIFIVHLPRLIFQILLISYAAAFNNRPTLTANPAEHLKRAKKILKRGRLSELLYAAVELRFALERMAQRDLLLTDLASERILKEYDPSKKLANLHRIAPESAYSHDIFLVNKKTGERLKWGEYKPLDRDRVAAIKGRLGDLLHPKDGLRLGIPDDPWYIEIRRFLFETADYLSIVYKDNSPFFVYEGLENFEKVKVE